MSNTGDEVVSRGRIPSMKQPDDERAPTGGDAECATEEHIVSPIRQHPDWALQRAVGLFRALGDEARLRTLEMLVQQERCVSELAQVSGESVSTVSHRLRLLRNEGLVTKRRDGRHIYYTLADHHVFELIRNALDHAVEHDPRT